MELGRRFRFEESHCWQVSKLSGLLFDHLASLHAFGCRERFLLTMAGLLHDVGVCRDFQGHHKHSRDIILESKFSVISKHERLLVANIARYHRKSAPKNTHRHYSGLGNNDKRRVAGLSAILRLADALDRDHLQKVEDLSAEIRSCEAVLVVKAKGNLFAEAWAIEKKSPLFEEIFGIKVTLRNSKER